VLNSFGGTTGSAGGAFTLGGRSNRGSFSWLANPAFKISDNVLLYGSASYGEKSGAANTAATAGLGNAILTQPEKSLDFEAGIKASIRHGFATVNVNFYNNTITNYQDTQVNTDVPALGAYLANVGNAAARG
jgi:iron complex outermembrane receptor protein